MLLCLRADTVIRIEKHDIRAMKSAPFPHPPCAPLDARWHRFAVKQCASGPDSGLFKSGNTALRQRGEPRVKFSVEQTPRRFIAPFEMPSVRASVVSRRVVPCDVERPVCTGKRTQKGKAVVDADQRRRILGKSLDQPVGDALGRRTQRRD